MPCAYRIAWQYVDIGLGPAAWQGRAAIYSAMDVRPCLILIDGLAYAVTPTIGHRPKLGEQKLAALGATRLSAATSAR